MRLKLKLEKEICYENSAFAKKKKLIVLFSLALVWALIAPSHAGPLPTGYDLGKKTIWTEGDRTDVFLKISDYTCPAGSADAAPDKDMWIPVDIPILDGTKARAAIIFGHAFAEQNTTPESNGISVHLSRDGTSGFSPFNQLAQSKVNLANQAGDEHAMMIIDLDENKDFKVLFHFGELFSSADETELCFWGARLQLLGWIEK